MVTNNNSDIIVNPLKEFPSSSCEDDTMKKAYMTNVETLTKKFKRLFDTFEANMKKKTKYSKRGKISSNKLYKYSFDNNIFKKVENKYEHFDISFIFLVDISGSMASACQAPSGDVLSRLDLSKAIMKAITNSISKTLKGKVKIEILLKSAPDVPFNDLGSPGFLSWVYSSDSKHLDSNIIDKINFFNPLKSKRWSSTPELLLAKGVLFFLKKFVKTKNSIIINLTDGDTFCRLQSKGTSEVPYSWGCESNTKCLKKYFKGFPFISIIIDPLSSKDTKGYINPVMANGNTFATKFRTVLTKMVNSFTEI